MCLLSDILKRVAKDNICRFHCLFQINSVWEDRVVLLSKITQVQMYALEDKTDDVK